MTKLNYSEILVNLDKNLLSYYYLSLSSPLPEKSTLNKAIIESIINRQ